MSQTMSQAESNKNRLLLLLGIAMLLALLSVPGIIAGFVLAMMVVAWLLVANATPVSNRTLVAILSGAVIVTQLVFLYGAFLR